jgi:hypothetical protein
MIVVEHPPISARALRLPVLLAATALALAACTAGGSTPTDPASTRTDVITVPPSSVAPTAPVSSGPTTVHKASSCPFVAQEFVHQTMGMRLGRVTVLRSGGRAVGCRIYALQGGSLHVTENLPGPKQPAVEILTQRYPSATAAHNAFVRLAEKGTNQQQTPLAKGLIGLCYQNDFDPHDHGTDYACAVNHGATEVVVRTVDTTTTVNTAAVTKAVLRAL